MSDDLRTRIAAIYRAHRLTFFARHGASVPKCGCGWRSPEEYTTFTDHPEHVADAVIRELEAGYILVPKSATLIAEAKAAYAAIPAERRADLERRFNDAQDAALHHQEYRRD